MKTYKTLDILEKILDPSELSSNIFKQPVELISVKRDTPTTSPGGVVTVECKKSIYPNPSLHSVIIKLMKLGFCDKDVKFKIKWNDD